MYFIEIFTNVKFNNQKWKIRRKNILTSLICNARLYIILFIHICYLMLSRKFFLKRGRYILYHMTSWQPLNHLIIILWYMVMDYLIVVGYYMYFLSNVCWCIIWENTFFLSYKNVMYFEGWRYVTFYIVLFMCERGQIVSDMIKNFEGRTHLFVNIFFFFFQIINLSVYGLRGTRLILRLFYWFYTNSMYFTKTHCMMIVTAFGWCHHFQLLID